MYDLFLDCSAGFFGDNCSESCPFPQYGLLCNETCDCSNSSCHQIYGCRTTTLIPTGDVFVILDAKYRHLEESLVKYYLRYLCNNFLMNWKQVRMAKITSVCIFIINIVWDIGANIYPFILISFEFNSFRVLYKLELPTFRKSMHENKDYVYIMIRISLCFHPSSSLLIFCAIAD